MGDWAAPAGRWKAERRSQITPAVKGGGTAVLTILLLSTRSLVLVDFVACSRSLLKQKGTTEAAEVPLSQPCTETTLLVHKKHIC